MRRDLVVDAETLDAADVTVLNDKHARSVPARDVIGVRARVL